MGDGSFVKDVRLVALGTAAAGVGMLVAGNSHFWMRVYFGAGSSDAWDLTGLLFILITLGTSIVIAVAEWPDFNWIDENRRLSIVAFCGAMAVLCIVAGRVASHAHKSRRGAA